MSVAPSPVRPRRTNPATAVLAALGLALLLAGCQLPEDAAAVEVDGSLVEPAEVDITVITHAAPGDQFWDVVQAGTAAAAEELDIRVQYTNSPDPGDQATLIDNAVAQGSNGLVVSMANPDALRASIRSAVRAGVPVVTINSGIEEWQAFGALTHVGQSETIAGQAAGERLAEDGLAKVVCVIQEPGNIALEQRCAAARETFDGELENLQVDGTDTTGTTASITSKLRADAEVDGVLTLNGQIAARAVQAVEASGSEAAVATFDVDEGVLQRILREQVSFAIDQQPFAQGYEGVSAVYLRLTRGVTLGGGEPIYTGPTVIDATTAETALAALSGAVR